MLANHADINAKDSNGRTALHAAAEGGKGNNKNIAEVLLAHDAEVNAKDRFGETPLHIAAHHASAEVAEVLLAHNADVNAKDNNGHTPLHATKEWGGSPYIYVQSIVDLQNMAALLREHGGHE